MNKLKSLKFNYRVYRFIKRSINRYPNIFTPSNRNIRRMGLHWQSHKLKMIDENEELIRKISYGEIKINEISENISLILKMGKSITEIGECYNLGDKSEKAKNEILKILNKNDLLDQDVSHILGSIMEKRYFNSRKSSIRK